MSRAIPTALAVAAFAAPTLASGQSDDVEAVAMLSGDCVRLVQADMDVTSYCQPSMINTTYRTGRSMWSFILPNGVVSFSGWGNQQVFMDEDTAEHPIDRVMLDLGIEGVEPGEAAGVGKCRFGNPSAPVRISCRISTSIGDFEAVFDTDGNPPRMLPSR